jgi:hypothetical protein
MGTSIILNSAANGSGVYANAGIGELEFPDAAQVRELGMFGWKSVLKKVSYTCLFQHLYNDDL